ncbi:MAG: hypothetical protein M1827_006370 [Pycnora praestabilis]|nr:MAG: hypothetical protein M1827_006370 [Pycnora praestabilis]
MRLRLTIHRHGLPASQILWTSSGLHRSIAAAGASFTISQLLEQVNDIVPLESDDWGLEDYIVEVRGFECLHFSELGELLRDEDEVRLSGRHQISFDGKHLIDGVAFGRPFLRRADRPAITIPPRKRRRLTYSDDEDTENKSGVPERKLAIKGGFGDADMDEEDEDDGDFEPEDDTEDFAIENQLREDPRDLAHDNGSNEKIERSMLLDGGGDKSEGVSTGSRRRRALVLEDGETLELVDDDGQPFPDEYHNALLGYPKASDASLPQPGLESQGAATKLKKKGNWKCPENVQNATNVSTSTSGRVSNTSEKSVRFQGTEKQDTTVVTITEQENGEDEDESDDAGFFPGEILPLDKDKHNSNSGSESSDDDESSETVSSVSSLSSSSLSSSDEEESSRSESEPEEVPISEDKAKTLKQNTVAAGKQQQQPKPVMKDTAPGQGQNKTRMRNQRRRNHKKLIRLKATGILPANATATDLASWRANPSQYAAEPVERSDDEDEAGKGKNAVEEFEAKRQELLASLASGGIEVGTTEPQQPKAPVAEAILAVKSEATLQESEDAHVETERASSHAKPAAMESSEPSEPPRRRAKLDVASSRRLLFGSLGLRTPKSKEEENIMRTKSVVAAKSAANKQDTTVQYMYNKSCNVEEGQALPTAEPNDYKSSISISTFNDDMNSWKGRINLSAVECCHEGVELSTPPFPFVQRWDPQQQVYKDKYGAKKGRKGKRRKWNHSQYNEEIEQSYNEYQDAQNLQSAEEADISLNYDVSNSLQAQNEAQNIESEDTQSAVNDQLMRDADGLSASAVQTLSEDDDLLHIPADPTACDPLVQAHAQAGAVIIFKQLDMSQETNWQPRISEYRTAIINNASGDGTLEMTLAKRDRPNREKLFDDETGERVYAKFEMPDYEDDDTEGDDGFVKVSYAELIEPKLLRAPNPEEAPPKQRHTLRPDHNNPGSEALTNKLTHKPGDGDPTADLISNPLQKLQHPHGDYIDPAVEGTKLVIGTLADKETRDKLINGPKAINGLDENSQITSNVRRENARPIKDAGFRPNIDSELLYETDVHSSRPRDTKIEFDQERSLFNGISGHISDEGGRGILSPRFNGLVSSPPGAESFREMTSSPIGSRLPTSHITRGHEQYDVETTDAGTTQSLSVIEASYPGLPVADVDKSFGESDDGPHFDEENQDPCIQGTVDESETLHAEQEGEVHAQSATNAVANNSRGQEMALEEAYNLLGIGDHTLEDGMVLTLYEICISESPSKQADLLKALKVINEARNSLNLKQYLDFNSDPGLHAATPLIQPSAEGKHSGASSDNEFPTLETVFSTAHSSFETIKEDRQSTQPRSSSERNRKAFSQNKNNTSDIALSAESDLLTPRASQIPPPSSKIVDLTLSTSNPGEPDPLKPNNEDDEEYHGNGYGLPRGPGWVKKRKLRSGSQGDETGIGMRKKANIMTR